VVDGPRLALVILLVLVGVGIAAVLVTETIEARRARRWTERDDRAVELHAKGRR